MPDHNTTADLVTIASCTTDLLRWLRFWPLYSAEAGQEKG